MYYRIGDGAMLKYNLCVLFKYLRTAKNMTQDELGYEMGMQQDTIGKYENGVYTWTLDKVVQFARFHDIPVHTIMYIAETAESDEEVIEQIEEKGLL